MSSHTKDPLEKHDTPSESGEPQSESEVSEAEDHLEHLKIAERAAKKKAKDGSVEMKPLDSPNQETNKDELLNEPIAGPSGLQNPPMVGYSDSTSNSEPQDALMLDSNNENIQEEVADEHIGDELAGENIVAAVQERNQDDAEDAPPSGDSGHISIAYIRSQEEPAAMPSGIQARRRAERDIDDVGFPDCLPHSSSSRRTLPSSDSANSSLDIPDLPSSSADISDSEKTSEGISDIHSQLVDMSARGSVYHDAAENVPMEDSSSVYETAVERQYSESSDANVSDLPEDSIPGSSASISTNTGEEGNRAYLARLQREADERGILISTSSGVGSTDQSELANLQRWGQAGEMGYRPNLDDIIDAPDQEASDHGAQGEVPTAIQDEQTLESQSMQGADGLFQREEHKGENEKSNITEDAVSKNEACGMKVEEKPGVSKVEEAPPSVRRKTRCYSDSNSAENVAVKLRPKVKADARKSKLAVIKSGVSSRSSSESPIPKSSSSDELYRKESPEMKSLSGSQSEKDKKSWQQPGQLRSMQRLTIPSKDSVITEEEENLLSPQRRQSPELMETKDITPEKMETTPEKSEDSTRTEQSDQMSSALAYTDQAHGSEADATLKEHELSFDFSESERSVGQTKRPGGKLSSSPPSDGRLGSTPPTDATFRPKKKPRDDKKQGKSRRTRTDSGGSLTNVSLERVKQEDSASASSTSDFTESEGETAL